MSKCINYYWRILATGICFLSFSIGGLLLSFIVFPLIAILPMRQDLRICLSQQFVHYSFRFFVGMMKWLGVLKLNIIGVEKLKQPGQLVIANHPSLIDVVVLISLLQETACIVKQALWRNVFLSRVVTATGYISNSNPEQLINDCVECLQKNHTLIIFPEGTRTEPGKLPSQFQRGAANIALRSGVGITPVVISCRPSTLTKGDKWYNVPREGRVYMELEVGNPIHIKPYLEMAPMSVATRRLTGALENYFQQEVMSYE